MGPLPRGRFPGFGEALVAGARSGAPGDGLLGDGAGSYNYKRV